MFVTCQSFIKKINEIKEGITAFEKNMKERLKGCDGKSLPDDAKIPTCEVMNAAIKKGLDDGFIEKISDLITNTGWRLDTKNRLVLPECRRKVKTVTAPYTISDDDEVVVVQNGGTIFIPSIELGREVMIIQSTAETVQLNATYGTRLIAPFSGSLNLAGENAAVSLLATADNTVRVFGQTAEE